MQRPADEERNGHFERSAISIAVITTIPAIGTLKVAVQWRGREAQSVPDIPVIVAITNEVIGKNSGLRNNAPPDSLTIPSLI